MSSMFHVDRTLTFADLVNMFSSSGLALSMINRATNITNQPKTPRQLSVLFQRSGPLRLSGFRSVLFSVICTFPYTMDCCRVQFKNFNRFYHLSICNSIYIFNEPFQPIIFLAKLKHLSS